MLDSTAVLNIFEKQTELSIRKTRALCFKRLLELKPDYVYQASAIDEKLLYSITQLGLKVEQNTAEP